MGYYVRRLLGMNHTFASRQEAVDVAEAALRVQLLLANMLQTQRNGHAPIPLAVPPRPPPMPPTKG